MSRSRLQFGKSQRKILEDFKRYLDNLFITERSKIEYYRAVQTFLKQHRQITQKTITEFLQKHPRFNYLTALKNLCRCLNISNIQFPPSKRLKIIKPRKEPLHIPRETLYNYIKRLIPLAEKKAEEYKQKAEEFKKKYLSITDRYAKNYEKRKKRALKDYRYNYKKYCDFLDLKVILLLLLDYGTRIRELLELRTTDINFTKKKITFHTKTHKDRILDIRDYTLENLKNIIDEKGLIIPVGEVERGFEGEFIFYSHYTEKKPNKYETNQKNLLLLRKLKYDLFRRDLSTLMENSNLPPLTKTHAFRRALINYLIEEKNLDILTVASFMEQTTPTVEIYVSERTKEQKKKKVFEIIAGEDKKLE